MCIIDTEIERERERKGGRERGEEDGGRQKTLTSVSVLVDIETWSFLKQITYFGPSVTNTK